MAPPPFPTRPRPNRLTSMALLCLLVGLVGCKTESGKRAEQEKLRAAFLAGQQTAQPQFQQTQGITVIGEVRKTKILWRPGITLAEAIVEADYIGFLEPRSIFIVRAGSRYEIDTYALLAGASNPPIEPGDVIELRR